MAASAPPLSSLLECSICMREFCLRDDSTSDPMLLACGHTFCALCLEALLKKLLQTPVATKIYNLPCPTCREITMVSQSKPLRKNYQLMALLEVLHKNPDLRTQAENSSPASQEEQSVPTMACDDNYNSSPPVSPHTISASCTAPSTKNELPNAKINASSMARCPSAPPAPASLYESAPPIVHTMSSDAVVMAPRPAGGELPKSANLASDAQKVISANLPEEELLFLPFYITIADASIAFDKWLAGLWWAPQDIKSRRLENARAVLVPFWAFSGSVAAHSYLKIEREKVLQTLEHRCVEEFTDVMICACTHNKITALVTQCFPSWHTNGLRRYNKRAHPQPLQQQAASSSSGFFGGLLDILKNLISSDVANTNEFPTQEILPFQADPYVVWEEKLEQAQLDQAHDKCCRVLNESVPTGATIVGSPSRNTRVLKVSWRLLYFPLFIMEYTYRSSPYTALVRGTDASVVGERPYRSGLLSSSVKFFKGNVS